MVDPKSIFSTPRKKSTQVLQTERQRCKYIEAAIAKGIPPKLAKLIVDKKCTPKQIDPVVASYTGKCALTGILLTDLGSSPNSAVYRATEGRFISKLAKELIQSSKLGEDLFIQFCKLIAKNHNGNINKPASVGGRDENNYEPPREERPESARVRDYKWEDLC
jgi:hypothetical protein